MDTNTINSIKARDGKEFIFDDVSEVNRLFELQKINKTKIRQTSVSERIQKLKKFERSIQTRRTEIELALYKDLQKNAFEANYSEIFGTLSEIRYFIKNLGKWMKRQKVSNSFAYLGSTSSIMYEAKGNCLIITPWNYPFYLTMSHLVASVGAGNVTIIKPSESTPYTSDLIRQIISEVFDENEVAVVFAGKDISEILTRMPFEHIHFTGSTTTGKRIMEAASENLCSVTLELGGKSPVIIDENYPIANCIKQIGWGKFINAGQTCIAPDYVLVHSSKKDEFITQLKSYLASSFGLHPMESDIMTCIIHVAHHDKLVGLLQNAVASGAAVLHGGNFDRENLRFEPTLVEINDLNSELMQQEIFGPILPIVTYDTLEEALFIINSRPKPLAMYLFSNDNKWLDQVLSNTSSGGVSINDTMAHFVQTYLPMGGVNHSGIGKSHGHFGFLEFSNQRAVLKSHIKGGITWPFQFPYTNFKKKLLEVLLKWF